MTLLVDIGNSAIKWSQWNGQMLEPARIIQYDQLNEQVFNDIEQHNPANTWIVGNVAGDAASRLLSRWSQTRGIRLRFITTQAEHAGVTNAYDEPAQLGVDRWLGIIAAHKLRPGHNIVVSFGTAVTLDAVNADGSHLGGFIIPGWKLMRDSFNQRAQHLQTLGELHKDAPALHQELAHNTRDAIHNGIANAIFGMVQAGIAQSGFTADQYSLFLTGGDAHRFLPLFDSDIVYEPNLVLLGLSQFVDSQEVEPGPAL
jgi:type III pantothenate kinase